MAIDHFEIKRRGKALCLSWGSTEGKSTFRRTMSADRALPFYTSGAWLYIGGIKDPFRFLTQAEAEKACSLVEDAYFDEIKA